jgi:hypothetical protein
MMLRVIAALLLGAAPLRAEPLAVGDTLEAIELTDQHGELRRIDASRRAVVFTRDMEAGEVLKQALATDGAALLERSGAAYVADVSGMPALVLRIFALRKLRQRPYPMLLDRDGSKTARLPAQPGKVSVIVLEALQVKAVRFLGSADEVRAALGAAAP